MCDDCRAWFQEKTKGSTVGGVKEARNQQQVMSKPDRPAAEGPAENSAQEENVRAGASGNRTAGGDVSGGGKRKLAAILGAAAVLVLAGGGILFALVRSGGSGHEDQEAALASTLPDDEENNSDPVQNDSEMSEQESESGEGQEREAQEVETQETETQDEKNRTADNPGTDGQDEEDPQTEASENEAEDSREREEGEDGDSDDQMAEDVYDSTEGGIHRYTYHVDDCSWSEAFQKARESGGYLVRINSREEFDFLIGEITKQGYEKIQFRIGGHRDGGSTEYYWLDEDGNPYGDLVNGSDYWCHDLWMVDEPSYRDGDIEEDCLDMFYFANESRWVWNDVPDDIIEVVPYYSGKIGYIVEYED